MIPLDTFWNFIRFRPGLAAIGREWETCLGTAGWDKLRPGLFISDGEASACCHPDDGRSLKLIARKDGSYCAVCPTTGDIELNGLSRKAILAYRLDPRQIRVRVAAALDITPDKTPIHNPHEAIPLGTWGPVTGRHVPVHLLLASTQRQLTGQIDNILHAESPDGILLLAPHAPSIPTAQHTLLSSKKAAVLALSKIIQCDAEGNFTASSQWTTFHNSFIHRSYPANVVLAAPDYQFVKKNMWAIRFNGTETFLESTLKGPVFIKYLLLHQGEEIHVARILADIAGDERLAQASDAGDTISKEEIAQYRKQYDELMSDRKEAAEWNDEGRLQTIDEELGQIAAHLSPLLGLGGRSRKASDAVGRIRKAIARVIGIALDKTRESDAALEQHLHSSIKMHTFMSYQPENRIDWKFE